MEGTDGNDEDEIITSKFTVAELWQRLPSLLVEETFGYLTLQNGGRLCRASTGWKDLLYRHALFNKGITFYQPTRSAPYRWFDEDEEPWFWGKQLYVKSNTMDHFVFVEKPDSEHSRSSMIYGPLSDKLALLDQPLGTLTLYNHRSVSSDWCLKSLRELLRKKPMTVCFVDCAVGVTVTMFEYFSVGHIMSRDMLIRDWFRWDLSLPHIHLTLDKETFQTLEPVIVAHDNFWRGRDPVVKVYDEWIVATVAGCLDKLTSLLWPYPVEQLQWLKTCLESFGTTVESFIVAELPIAYSAYNNARQTLFGARLDESVKRMGMRWKDQDLDVVDCAFLARLMNMTPGMPKPPYDLPEEMTAF